MNFIFPDIIFSKRRNGSVEPRVPPASSSSHPKRPHISHKMEAPQDPPREVSELIECLLLEESEAISEEICPVFWDFAGQSVYHATHPVFMSPKAVYLLVWDISKNLYAPAECRVKESGLEQRVIESGSYGESNLDHVTKWLSLVHFFHQSEPSQNGQMLPPVVLVGTHADRVEGDPWKSMESVLKTIQGKVFSAHVVPAQFVVNNTLAGRPFDQEDPAIHHLRQRLLSLASDLPHTKKEFPLEWLQLEKAVGSLVSKGLKFIGKEEFEDVVREFCDIEIESDCDDVLVFLHDRGAVVYCRGCTEEDDEVVVLDPRWLVDQFSKIITVTPGKAEPMEIRELRRLLEQEGVLSVKLVSYTCKNLDLEHAQDTLLDIMERFGLICKWSQQNSQAVYLVPCMLTARSQDDITHVTETCQLEPLFLTFRRGYVPPGFFSRLLVHFARWCAARWAQEQPKLFANAARFYVGQNNDISLVFVCHTTVIKVCVLQEHKPSPSREAFLLCRTVHWYV